MEITNLMPEWGERISTPGLLHAPTLTVVPTGPRAGRLSAQEHSGLPPGGAIFFSESRKKYAPSGEVVGHRIEIGYTDLLGRPIRTRNRQ